MKLLFDENLSPNLVTLVRDECPDSAHVRDVALRGAPDRRVWEHARENGFVIRSTRRIVHGDQHGNRRLGVARRDLVALGRGLRGRVEHPPEQPVRLGDFSRIDLGASARPDTFAISFADPIDDPTFNLIDLQGTGGRVTVTPGDTTFTSDPAARGAETRSP